MTAVRESTQALSREDIALLTGPDVQAKIAQAAKEVRASRTREPLSAGDAARRIRPSETTERERAAAAVIRRVATRAVGDTEHADRLLAQAEADARTAWRAARIAARRAAWVTRLPTRYASASLDGLLPQQDPGGKVSRWLAATHVRSLLLLGPARGGKTHAAYAIGNAAHEAGMWVEAWTAHELCRASMPKADSNPYERATDAALLIVDDLGREHVGEWWLAALHQLLDERCKHNRRTVVTGNVRIEADTAEDKLGEAYTQLAARYGDPIVERIVDGGGTLLIEGTPLGGMVEW